MSVTEFRGKYRFLSNFHPSLVLLDGALYPTVEHAYQAAKTLDYETRKRIRLMEKPGGAKRVGREVALRPNWEEIKLDIMLNLLRQKFLDTSLRELLSETTGDLVEENHWGDTFWGVCRGVGQNNLGYLLMQVREEK